MNKTETCRPKYDRLVIELKEMLNSKCLFLHSAIIYGSYSRREIFSIHSDIDLLCVIKHKVIENEEVNTLLEIVNALHSKYAIKIHLRIRNISDLYTKDSGFLDCGFTSSINKLRDGILLCGVSLDSAYFEYINSITEEEYIYNLRLRYSELKYQSRALVSIKTNFGNTSDYEEIISYKCGCIIFQLAELICYSYGFHFISSVDALFRAYSLTKNHYFKTAVSLKNSLLKINIADFVSSIDKIVNHYNQEIVSSNLITLKRIILHKNQKNDNTNSIPNEYEKPDSNFFNNNSSIFTKKSYISADGALHILTNV